MRIIVLNNYLIQQIKIYLLITGLIVFNIIAKSQVSGISASKLATYNAGTVADKKLEFEPAFNSSFSSRFYDTDGNINYKYQNKDTIDNESEFSFRITYGLLDKIEIGLSIPTNAEEISIGTKYLFFEKETIALAGILGINTVLNTSLPKNNATYTESLKGAMGLVGTVQFTEKLSLDLDYQIQIALKNTVDNHRLDNFINADLGYYVFSWLQPIIGLNYKQYVFTDNINNSGILLFNTGFTVEAFHKFLLIINSPVSIAGKNFNYIRGFGFALTVIFE